MEDKKNKVIVTIRNKEYTIIANESIEYILSIGEELNSRISRILSLNSSLNPEKTAILAALNLCDEHVKLNNANIDLQRQTEKYMYELKKAKEKINKLSGDDNIEYDIEEENNKYSDDLENAYEKISKYEDEIKALKEELEKEKQQNQQNLTSLKKEYNDGINNILKEYKAKEKEILDMIDNM